MDMAQTVSMKMEQDRDPVLPLAENSHAAIRQITAICFPDSQADRAICPITGSFVLCIFDHSANCPNRAIHRDENRRMHP